MNEKWIWLPDWASNLGIWEDDLMDVAPSANHICQEKLSYNSLLHYLSPSLQGGVRGESFHSSPTSSLIQS